MLGLFKETAKMVQILARMAPMAYKCGGFKAALLLDRSVTDTSILLGQHDGYRRSLRDACIRIAKASPDHTAVDVADIANSAAVAGESVYVALKRLKDRYNA